MSNQITCPKCNQVFEMDAAGYASIANQVRSSEFEAEVHKRLEEREKLHELAIELAKSEVIEEKDKEFANKDQQIQRLKSELNATKESKEMELQLALSQAKSPL